jgi:hypothetical protein
VTHLSQRLTRNRNRTVTDVRPALLVTAAAAETQATPRGPADSESDQQAGPQSCCRFHSRRHRRNARRRSRAEADRLVVDARPARTGAGPPAVSVPGATYRPFPDDSRPAQVRVSVPWDRRAGPVTAAREVSGEEERPAVRAELEALERAHR